MRRIPTAVSLVTSIAARRPVARVRGVVIMPVFRQSIKHLLSFLYAILALECVNIDFSIDIVRKAGYDRHRTGWAAIWDSTRQPAARNTDSPTMELAE
jgi:hypothetical protein